MSDLRAWPLAAAALLFCSCSSHGEGAGSTAGGWVKYSGNPVIGGWLTGTVFDVSVLSDSGRYRMWASWRKKNSIATTESADGVHWSDLVTVLGPSDLTWESAVNRPSVIKTGSKYHMWYTGQANGHSSIGYATSNDGIRWFRAARTPVLTAGAVWEKEAVMNPSVIYDAATGGFRMWYSGGEQYEPDAIGYATSADGIHWDKDPANPVFRCDPGRAWESAKVAGAEVIQDGGWFYIFYIGYRDVNHSSINLARSKDGISGWERNPRNPIIRPGEGSWDRDADYKPFALPDPSGNWMLWYNGRHGSAERIGLATHHGSPFDWR